LRETSRALKGRLRKAILKEQEVRAAAARRAREKRLYQRQEIEGVGHSGKKKKLMRKAVDINMVSPSSMFSPSSKDEIERQKLEVDDLKYQLASANRKIEHLTDVVAGRSGSHPRRRVVRDDGAGQIHERLDSPAGDAVTIASANRQDDRHHVRTRHAPVPSPLTKTNRSYHRISRELHARHPSDDSPALELLEQERRPLKAMFEFYASKRKMKAGRQHQQSRTKKPTMFMTGPDFNRFCFDFNIVPGAFCVFIFAWCV
jgi:hypothetical protein